MMLNGKFSSILSLLWRILPLILLFISCSSSSRLSRKPIQEGIASWYGPNFHGKTTANGEKYNMNKMTAAHKTLPFNTVVVVVNTSNNKWVEVRINDRGPYVDDRIIDVSKAAAKKLGMLNSGTAPVVLYQKLAGNQAPSVATNAEQFTVQVGSYNDKPSAQRRAKEIKDAWVKRVSVEGKVMFRVYVGKYDSKSKADSKRKALRRDGIVGFVKQV